jgi:single-stranded-DNA-specific exonuclease
MEVSTNATTKPSPIRPQPVRKPASAPVMGELHPVILKLFASRGYDAKSIQEFLSWDLKNIPELTQLKDLNKAALKILEVINRNEKIVIYGDYDVDGTTSCALLYHFFRLIGVEVLTLQPSRFIEGYGLHNSSVDKAKEMGASLMITVDCGITNCEAADYALEAGVDLIITDHHKDMRDEMPKAFAVINPNRRDETCEPSLRTLAGVGVAFCLALEVKKEMEKAGKTCPSLYELLQFVAIGTICDLAKLSPVNVRLVRHGMKLIKTTTYPGLKTFFPPEDRALPVIPSEKLSFHVGPLINSKGRLEHPERALELLTTLDQGVANLAFSHLEICNKERKLIQNEVFESAREQVLQELTKSPNLPAAIVFDPSWHEGVIGIVASKLVETFSIPAVVFTHAEKEGIIKASARSIGEMNIFDCLKELDQLFEKFGGHKAAAGLSMKAENFTVFKEAMLSKISAIPQILRAPTGQYELEISLSDITPELAKQLDLLEPFGMGNARPKFKMKGFVLESYDILKESHVRWNFSSKDDKPIRQKGISFNYLTKWDTQSPEEIFDLQYSKDVDLAAYFTLGINRWNGREFIQLQVDKVFIE